VGSEWKALGKRLCPERSSYAKRTDEWRPATFRQHVGGRTRQLAPVPKICSGYDPGLTKRAQLPAASEIAQLLPIPASAVFTVLQSKVRPEIDTLSAY
jgi:hypothetical protein